MSPHNVISQAAAIPWRRDAAGKMQILLIRWKNEEKWGIPKGKVDAGKDLRYTAANESLEEAGVEGILSAKPIGSFSYAKERGGERLVDVYGLEVTREHESYLEVSHRVRQWFDVATAAEICGKKQVRRLILELARELA